MEWDELEAFAAVAEELNFGRAARRLHVSSPAVSQRILRLERRLGTRLFDRTTRRVVLTPAGVVLRDEMADLTAVLQRIRDRVTRTDPETPADATLALVGVPAAPVVRRLRRDLPGPRWRAVALSATAEAAAAVREEVRAALVYVHPRTPWSGFRGLATATVVREPLWIYVPAGHPLAGRDRLWARELSAERWIVPADPAARRALSRLGLESGFRPRVHHVFSDPREALRLVADAAGIAAGSPVWPLAEGVRRMPLVASASAGVRLVWDPTRVDATWSAALLPPLRALYAEIARRQNPDWWAGQGSAGTLTGEA